MFKKATLFLVLGSLIFLSACSVKKSGELSLEEAKVRAENFINENFLDPLDPVKIISIEDDKQTGLYKFTIDFGDGELMDSYISKDGKSLFPQAFDIKEIEEQNEALKKLENELEGDSGELIETGEAIEIEDFDALLGSGILESEKKVVLYFFWGEGCPHCSNQREAMKPWLEKYPDLEIKEFETWSNDNNRTFLESLAGKYNTAVQGVPMTFLGDKYWVGFSESMGKEITDKIDECLKSSCENPGDRLK